VRPLLERDGAPYNKVLKSALERILNWALSDRGWLQSSLPVRMGDLGIRHAVDAAIPCFIASLPSVLPLVEALLPAGILGADSTLEEAIDLWKERGVFVEPPEDKRGVQEEWEAPLHDRERRLRSHPEVRGCAFYQGAVGVLPCGWKAARWSHPGRLVPREAPSVGLHLQRLQRHLRPIVSRINGDAPWVGRGRSCKRQEQEVRVFGGRVHLCSTLL